jgi:group I intron endonuclease
MKKSNNGVYKILNKVNNKIYIGSTNNFKRRETEHFRNLKNNKHENSYLQSAYNKHGKDNFMFEIIEETSDLFNREQYWMDLLDACNHNIGYNINKTADRPPSWQNKKHSEETKERIREYHMGLKMSKETKNKIGEANKKYKSFLGKNHSEESKMKISIKHTGKKLSEETKLKLSNACKGKVGKWNKDKILSEEHKSKISDNSPRKRKIINITTKEIFNSIKEASHFYKMSPSNISMACSNKIKTAGGYEWKYI